MVWRKEKNSAYFLDLENRYYTEKQSNKITLENGTETDDFNTILSEIQNYYCQLYKSYERERVTNWGNAVRSEFTQLGDIEREELEGEISYVELNEAFRSMKNNKIPGSDGFPVEFFNSLEGFR